MAASNTPHQPGLGDFPPDLGDAEMSDDVAGMMQQMGSGGGAGSAGSSGMPAGFPGTPGGAGGQGGQAGSGGQPQNARPVTDPLTEGKYFAGDVAKGLASILPDEIQKMLGVLPTTTPEEHAKNERLRQGFERLNAEQKQYAAKRIREEQERKQKEAEEEHQKRIKKQQEAQAKELPMPKGKSDGPDAGFGGSKKANVSKMISDQRQSLKDTAQ
jgi:hypothetical protein